MPSSEVASYFQGLIRHSLDEVNAELQNLSCISRSARFQTDGILVINDVYHNGDISDAVSACERIERLMSQDFQSYEDMNLEAVDGGWKGQQGHTLSHAGQLRKVMNLIDHGNEFKNMALHPSLIRIVSQLIGPRFRLRVGFIAGSARIIDAIRMHNSTFAVMIPEVCQRAAQAAFAAFNQETDENKGSIVAHVTKTLEKTVQGWRGLGWPEHALRLPQGGFKYLVAVPPGVRSQRSASGVEFAGVELLDYYIASRARVKLSTSRSFNVNNDGFLRVVLMQNLDEVEEVFRRFKTVGVTYGMTLPDSLCEEYGHFLSEHMNKDF